MYALMRHHHCQLSDILCASSGGCDILISMELMQAGVCALQSVCRYPLDVVKTRAQLAVGKAGGPKCVICWSCVRVSMFV